MGPIVSKIKSYLYSLYICFKKNLNEKYTYNIFNKHGGYNVNMGNKSYKKVKPKSIKEKL